MSGSRYDKSIIGKTFENSEGDKYIILRYDKLIKTQGTYIIRFLNTGYERSVYRTAINAGSIKDNLKPRKFGVGYVGDAIPKNNMKIYQLWSNMLSRCYNPGCKDYMSYGGIGISVCDRWHSFENFLNDLGDVEGYDFEAMMNNRIVLDKDKKQQSINHSQRIYSKESCCFIDKKENESYRDTEKYKKKFLATTPDMQEIEVIGIVQFAKENKLSPAAILRCLNGLQSNHKKWTFRHYSAM